MKPIDILEHRGEFFKVLDTTGNSQIAVMTLNPGQDSGPEEKHPGDQMVYVIEGEAEVTIEQQTHRVRMGECIIIPEMAKHHIYNRTDSNVFLMSVYAPPAY